MHHLAHLAWHSIDILMCAILRLGELHWLNLIVDVISNMMLVTESGRCCQQRLLQEFQIILTTLHPVEGNCLNKYW